MRLWVFASRVLSLLGVAWAAVTKDYVVIRAPGHVFHVPKKNLPDLGYLGWIHAIPGLDKKGPSFIFEFSGEELASEVSGYVIKHRHIEQKIIGSVAVLTPEELSRAKSDHHLRPLWMATEGYRDREVVFDQKIGLYRVYSSPDYKRSWDLLKVYPDSTKPAPANQYEFWVGECISGDITFGNGEKIVSCDSQFLIGDLVIDFSYSDKNLPHLDALKDFLRKKIAEWRQ